MCVNVFLLVVDLIDRFDWMSLRVTIDHVAPMCRHEVNVSCTSSNYYTSGKCTIYTEWNTDGNWRASSRG